MNRHVVLMILSALVIVGGGIYFFKQHKSAASTTVDNGASSVAVQQDTGKFSGSIADLSKRGGSWQCTVDSATAQAISSGTVYVSGKNVRADFSVDVKGYGKVNGSMIADGEYTYSWSSVIPQGIKTKMTAAGQGGTATSGQGVDANTSYSYDCQPWTPDESKFTIPTSVTFRTV